MDPSTNSGSAGTELPAPPLVPVPGLGDDAPSIAPAPAPPVDPVDTEAIQLRAEYLNAGSVTVASKVQNVINNYYRQVGNSDLGGFSTIALDHFDEIIEVEQIERVAAEVLCETSWVESSVTALKRNRVAVIVGPPELGKATAAYQIAAILHRDESFASILLSRSLKRTVRVDIRELGGGVPSFKGRLVILKNALAGGNDDLIRWLRGLDPARLDALREQLTKSGNFLILTSSPNKLGEIEASLRTLGVVVELKKPTREMLIECFRRQTARVLRSPALSDAALRDQVAERCQSEGSELAFQLGSLPRVVRFAQGYLIEMVQKKQSIDEALQRFDSPEHWLLEELPGDVEAWAAVLALVLCSAAPLLRSVPWLQFDRTRRDLANYMRRALGRSREQRDSRELCQARSILERARITVVSYPSMEPAGVVFRADLTERACRFSDRLWQALEGPGSEVLSFLLPFLRQRVDDADHYVRATAVRALGRLGAIDPGYIVSPLLIGWSEADDENRNDNLGLLFQGLLGSDDARYRDAALARLQRLSIDSEGRAGHVAIRTYGLIGAILPEVALRELGTIASARIRLQADALIEEGHKLMRVEALVLRGGASEEDMDLLRKVIWSRLSQVLVEDEEALGDLLFALAGIFVGHPDLEPVLVAVTDWMRREEASLRSIMASLLLADPGLMSLMEEQKRAIRFDSERPTESCSPFLAFCWQQEKASDILAVFIEELFRSTESLPGIFQRLLRDRLTGFLVGWLQEGSRIKPLRAAVIDLLARLYRSTNGALRDSLYQALRRHDITSNKHAQAIAVEVLTYRVSSVSLRPTLSSSSA